MFGKIQNRRSGIREWAFFGSGIRENEKNRSGIRESNPPEGGLYYGYPNNYNPKMSIILRRKG